MSASPERTFSAVARKNFKRLLTYWAQIGTLLSLAGAGLGFFSLYAYAEAIGRPDLFMDSIDAKSALVVWLLLVVLLLAAYLFVLSATTWLFGMTVSLFNKPPGKQREAVLWLLFPVLVGFGTFVFILYFHADGIGGRVAVLLVALAVLLSCLLMYALWDFRKLIRDALSVNGAQVKAGEKWFFMGFLWLLLFMTVSAGVFPATLTLQSYLGDDTPEAIPGLARLSLLTMVLTLVPVVIFYRVPGDLYRRITYAVTALILMSCATMLISPGSMGRITYSAAGKLNIRAHESTRYVLSDDIRLADLHGPLWKTRLGQSSRVEVNAWQLFSFGDVLLLCPDDLSERELRELRHYTSYCIKTRNSKVLRKPKTPVFPLREKNRWSCSAPPWFVADGHSVKPLNHGSI
ncbi:TPA: hypothetical protein L3715_002350 [Pseudomonas aeruginosa]|nr:hypothetical protein [Pseudomonas aeruginosa]